LPKCRVITRIEEYTTDTIWKERINELKKYHKILFLFGEGGGYTDNYITLLNRIFEKYNCIISVEHMSNIHCTGALRTFMVTESISKDEFSEVLPDIVITFGANFASDLKNKLRNNYLKIRHWRVSQQGNVVDTFMALDTIYECKDEIFFKKLLQFADSGMQNDLMYYNLWKTKIENIKFPDLDFTNFYAIGELTKRIPADSMLHLSILNSIRLTQFFELEKSVQVYANLGAFGIDGSLSTFLGQVVDEKKIKFLIIGDLGFFYDINATLIPYIDSNIRIFLINNHGGGEFHYVYHNAGFQNLNKHISAGHHSNASAWIENLPVKYLSARNREELNKALTEFVTDKSDKPIILEVFTDIKKDGDMLIKFYNINRHYKTSWVKKIVKAVKKRGVGYVKRIVKH
jgi:2-succinyl-5-enolpyruvyl-6-hydroxy-3-cyclohexene-1-carboxylate synthase